MKLIPLLLLIPLATVAQEDSIEQEPVTVKEIEEGSDRERAQRILLIAYRSEAVRDKCLQAPREHLDVALNGYEIPVDCLIWNRWYVAEQERLRQEAEAAAP